MANRSNSRFLADSARTRTKSLNDALQARNNSITIDLNNRVLTLYRDSQLFKSYPVAVGAPDSPTPTGNWTIAEKIANPGGPFGSRWMGLSIPWGSYGIHGTNMPDSIGTYASHGCVRMFNEDVIDLYNLVSIGTPVQIF
ncbi:MAG: L,D-transpeptidase [Thermacetogeniaceae bacterium]